MSRILAGTKKGLFEPGAPATFEGRPITALSAAGGHAWALVDGRELWRTTGDEWDRVATLPGQEGESLLAAGSGVFVGTDGAHLLRLEGNELQPVASFDRAPERDTWYTPWGGPPAVRSLSELDGELFVNVHVGGILRSRDLRAWRQTIDIDTDVHEVHGAGGRVYAALGAGGVAVSDDRGDSWRIVTAGLHGTYVRAVALAHDTVLATASSGPFSSDGAVYRLARDGARFEPCVGGIPARVEGNIDTGWLVARGSTVAVATPDGEIYRSVDEAGTWERVADGLPEPSWLALVE